MPFRQQHGRPLVAHQGVLQAGQDLGRQTGDAAEGDIEPAREEIGGGRGQPAVVAGDELDGRGRLACRLQHPLPGGDRSRHIDGQRPTAPPAVPREGGGQFVVGGQGPARVRQQPLPLRGERDLPGAAHEQHGTQLALQRPDVAAERLLGHIQPGRGTGEVQLLGNGHERPQPARREVVGHQETVGGRPPIHNTAA